MLGLSQDNGLIRINLVKFVQSFSNGFRNLFMSVLSILEVVKSFTTIGGVFARDDSVEQDHIKVDRCSRNCHDRVHEK